MMIFVHDLYTFSIGSRVSSVYALLETGFSFVLITIIAIVCRDCCIQKTIIHKLFKSFYESDYRYTPTDVVFNEKHKVIYLFYMFKPLYKSCIFTYKYRRRIWNLLSD